MAKGLVMLMKNTTIIRIFYFIRYFGDSLFYSFMQMYLIYLGFTESNIGLLLSIIPIISLIANPFWGLISTNVNTNRKLMKILTIFEGIFIITFCYNNIFLVLCILISCIAFVQAPYYNYMDGYSGTFCDQENKEYSSIRIMGTIAYVIGTLLGGFIIQYFGYQVCFTIAGSFYIVTSVFAFLIPKLKVAETKKEKVNYKVILTNKKFYGYLIILIFTVTISQIGDNFVSTYFTKHYTVTTSQYGMINAGIILTEFFTILIVGKFFLNVKPNKLLIVAGIAYTMRSLLLGLDISLGLSILGALLRGVGWGIFLTVHVKYLMKLVGIQNLTAAIFIYAIVSSLILFIGNNVFGSIIEAFGYRTCYFIITSCCLVATLINLSRELLHRKSN